MSIEERAPLLSNEIGSPNSSQRKEPYSNPEISTDIEKSVSDQVEPVTLSWSNINVYVMPKKKGCCGRGQTHEAPKQIINNVSGLVKPGSLVAIMGASGAGKSTLMNTLTFRNNGTLVIQGDVRVNGIVADKTKISNISAYVQQEDLFIGTLTVREHLTFRALLRMDKRKTRRERLKKVEDVINELGLTKCADTIIGTPGRIKGISGGEMKRLSFASESLTNPPLMFCDEATSGLDSFMAMSVVQSLEKMVSKGHTILCTIHQPSSEIYEMFDQVLLLAGGRLAFMGSSGDALEFFKSNGCPCPDNYNPADHYILTLAIMPGSVTECKSRVQTICDSFENSQPFKLIEEEIKTINDNRTVSQSFVEDILNDSSRYGASYFQQLRSVFWRSWLTVVRDPLIVKLRFMQTVFFAVILGLVYLKTNDDYNQEDIQNVNGNMFLVLLSISFNNIFADLNVFPEEIPVFLREYGTGLYRVDVYHLCKTFVEIPFLIALPVIYISILYWMCGLIYDFQKFCIAAGTGVLVANVAASCGFTISVGAPTVTAALSIAPPIMIPIVIFGGFFLNSGSIPDYLIWLQYLSWFSYSNEIMVVNQWKDVTSIACHANATCIRNGESVIASLNFSEDNVYLDVALLFVLLAGFRIFSFVILFIRARRSYT